LSIEFYDEALAAYPPYEDTPMRHMYQQVAKLIPRFSPVIDLGCGSGYLASALREVNYRGKYVGLDISPVGIKVAEACLQNRQLQIPLFENLDEYPYKFEVCDLYDWQPTIDDSTHQTIHTCFEVLEHVPDDCDIVSRVPARSRFIFSVPNYWSRSHVRTFDTVGTAFNRYSEFLSFKSWYILPTKQPEAAIHLYDTYRRADKW
jgi:SAM-dependent methyltransferase